MLNALRASTKLGPGAKNVLGQQPVFVFAAVCVIDEGLFKIFPISTERGKSALIAFKGKGCGGSSSIRDCEHLRTT